MNALLEILRRLFAGFGRKPAAQVPAGDSPRPQAAPADVMMTSAQLAEAMGCTLAKADAWLPHLLLAARLYDITTLPRLAAFLAQLGHESGGLRYVREIWGPTAAQSRYEGRADLGNTEPGDGRRYCGRGLIQTTGRANYRGTTSGLRALVADVPDFEAFPELLEQPTWAALSAGWYWQSHGCNALADRGDFIGITKRINGGTNGLADRQARWARARNALGVA